ncbi:MAG: hypothetical protein KKH12_10365 [Gammaproteobacteria bacterium]|nr:hypothetical protein [Gammaproteobacteria bacterium]MBU1482064.1 hypothetical protein [Gammaproteobacteria bacterium]
MKLLPNRKHLFQALLIVTLCGNNLHAATINTGDKNMNDLTKSMQPVCFGRLVIEVPTVSKIKGWEHEVDRTKIKTVDHHSPNRKSFDTKIAQQERQLRSSPHNTEGVLFKNRIRLTPDSELLVYREDRYDHFLYQLDAPFWQPTFEYLFHAETTDKYFDAGIARITKVVKNFIPTPSVTTDLLSLPPGLCIEHGVVTGNEFRGESVAIGGLIEEYPGLFFSFSTQSTDQGPEEPRMIERIERSFGMGDKMGNEITAATRFIRKGRRKLNGLDGQEIIAVMTLDGITSYEANAEFYGEPNSLDKPNINVSLSDQTHDDNTHKPYNKNLTEKEFITLWDTLLNGIKPRPKNQWGADSIKQ